MCSLHANSGVEQDVSLDSVYFAVGCVMLLVLVIGAVSDLVTRE